MGCGDGGGRVIDSSKGKGRAWGGVVGARGWRPGRKMEWNAHVRARAGRERESPPPELARDRRKARSPTRGLESFPVRERSNLPGACPTPGLRARSHVCRRIRSSLHLSQNEQPGPRSLDNDSCGAFDFADSLSKTTNQEAPTGSFGNRLTASNCSQIHWCVAASPSSSGVLGFQFRTSSSRM